MKKLSDELLLQTYYKALALKLNPQFIDLLKHELNTRSLYFKIKQSS
ncbi:sporulation histidine kinase inhibitor Sda [Sporosarcina sp. HYO08]|nr:sporulation histidine kinase inhibitor Sda [Sporosarcina sp. HYO08]KXH84176.1 sporulation protein [Sporosarcina sp. HYO08]